MRTPTNWWEKIAGYFILSAIVLFAILVFRPGQRDNSWFGFGPKPFSVYVTTNDGMDLAAGDKLTMKGIQIGEVESLELLGSKEVRIACSVYRKYENRITDDASFVISPPPVVGRGHIEVLPGTGTQLKTDAEVPGKLAVSLEEKADELLVKVEGIIDNANERVDQLDRTLTTLQAILDQVNKGEGTLGKFVYEDEFYNRVSALVTKLESSTDTIEKLRDPVLDLAENFPAFLAVMLTATGRLDTILANVEQGMEHFPAVASRLVVTLAESRKILESLKRNFLIRGNLPKDPEADDMAPVTQRRPLTTRNP